MRVVSKQEIIGQRVKQVWQTQPFTHSHPGQIDITTIELYVELRNGLLFDFSYPVDNPPPIHAVDRADLSLIPAQFVDSGAWVGEEVVELALSWYWSHMAVLLSNGLAITQTLIGEVFHPCLDEWWGTVQAEPSEYWAYMDRVPFDDLPHLDLESLRTKVRV